MKTVLLTLLLALLLAVAVAAGVVYSGAINVAADSPHWGPVHALLQTARERAIAVRAQALVVPALDDPARIRSGAGNYQAMCVSCHLSPGMPETELRQGLSPTPPNLARQGADDPAQAFWVIKHGIQASAMPAWGKSMEDAYIWDLVAFIRQLPTMDASTYRDWVARSDGHSHGGGEQMGDHHPHPPAEQPTPGAIPQPAKRTHVHPDGKEHVHHR